MKNLAFIPARGGSKRFPRKNLKPLGGASLVQRAIQSALDSEQFEQVVLSSDDQEILGHVSPGGKLVIDQRPEQLATDKATVLQAILEMMQRWRSEGRVFDTITIILPTCPFRKAEHIRAGFELFSDDVDSVISVTEYTFPWEMSLDIDENSVMTTSLNPSALVTGNTRSQDRRRVYHPNGAFYIGRWEVVERDKNFFKGRMKGYPMDEFHSADVDTEFDFKIANMILEEGLV